MAQDMGHGTGYDHGARHWAQSVSASSPQTPSHQPHWDTHPKPWGHWCPLEAGPALDLLEEGVARAVGVAELVVATQGKVWSDGARVDGTGQELVLHQGQGVGVQRGG